MGFIRLRVLECSAGGRGGFRLARVPHWGPHYQEILLFGGSILESPIFGNPPDVPRTPARGSMCRCAQLSSLPQPTAEFSALMGLGFIGFRFYRV